MLCADPVGCILMVVQFISVPAMTLLLLRFFAT
jgi:hypothetical protein